MSLEAAKKLIALGLPVIRLAEGSKIPVDKEFAATAARTVERATMMWTDPVMEWEQPYNVGISTDGYIGIDIDNKDGKDGDGELFKLEMAGYQFPPTFEQQTPTGGRHLVYRAKTPVANSAGSLAPGIDVRGVGGYLVGAGSQVAAGEYTANFQAVADAPDWMYEKLPKPIPKVIAVEKYPYVDEPRVEKRCTNYLTDDADLSLAGAGGNQTGYRVAARLKDLGASPEMALDLMLAHWNDRCQPPWSVGELVDLVNHAWAYGKEPAGVAAPESQFQPLQADPVRPSSPDRQSRHPFEELNKNYAFILAGGGHHILWEKTDPQGKFKLEHLNEQSFNKKFAAHTMLIEGEQVPVTVKWMKSGMRRSYDGFCFRPGLPTPTGYYNLFRGFAVEPTPVSDQSDRAKRGLAAFLNHAEENVCHGNKDLARWLLAYFAHIFQRPWEKPPVSLVFRGGKGVGKTSLIERVGYLLGSHHLLTANRRYLVGNFNGHLENLLLFTLEEAFWSGDKQAEGTLKDLITGSHHVIEHKGKEPYTVENCTRVIIIGNEEWLVPATQDERRFAVFDVGDARKQDSGFFQSMREDLENGGYGALLRYFLDYDLSGIDLGEAPKTQALHDQKLHTLEPFFQWWLDCLTAGTITGGEWKTEVSKDDFRNTFYGYLRSRQVRGRLPEERAIGRYLKQAMKSVDSTGKRREGAEYINVYRFPDLEQARKEWDKFMGHPGEWHELR